MKLNESDIKRIIRKVISEGSFNTLKRRSVLKITDMDILGSVIEDITTDIIENDDYDIPYFDGKTIPDVIKPYLDDIVDAIDFEDLNSMIWDLIVDYTNNSNKIQSVTDKIKEDLDQNS